MNSFPYYFPYYRRRLSFTFTLIAILFSLTFNSLAADQPTCINCHAKEVKAWQQSDHAHAMAKAAIDSVLGNFNEQQIEFNGKKVRFFQQGENYLVDIDERGEKERYKIIHTFGYEPLQQYIVETKPGTHQMLPYAWDSRTKENGGQQWIDLYDDVLSEKDRFHWKQPLQNWNGMCADCHSTGLTRHYNSDENTFSTVWDTVNVGCGSCHTLPENHAESHAQITKTVSAKDQAAKDQAMVEKSIAKVLSYDEAQTAMDKCFACHSLRTPLTDGINPKKAFLDQFKPNWVIPPLYHVDGQIKEEVYVYGSFLQSKMHQSGVTCLNCHDVHSGKIKYQDNRLCTQCHVSDTYDNKSHHQHDSNEGSQCVSCHMPETTYMKVDPRRDHSFSIPNLGFSQTYNTPLSCKQCHSDKDDKWLETNYSWTKEPSIWLTLYTDFIQGNTQNLTEAQWLELVTTREIGVLKRATAIAYLNFVDFQVSTIHLAKFAQDDQPLIQLAAIEVIARLAPQVKTPILAPMLEHKLKSVRVAAAQALINTPLSGSDKALFNKVFKELVDATGMQSWRGEGRVNLSNIYSQTARPAMAIEQLETAISIEPYYDVAYVNLADMYRVQQNEQQVKAWLDKGINNNPDSGILRYSLGLHYIRIANHQAALQAFEKAYSLDKNNWQFIYTLIMVYDELGLQAKKQKLLESIEQ